MKKRSGVTLIELITIIAIIGVLALIAIPRYIGYRARAYNGATDTFAKQIEMTQATYKAMHDAYASDINQLLAVDKNLTDTPYVTFIWINVAASGYTINVKQANGNRWVTVTNSGLSSF